MTTGAAPPPPDRVPTLTEVIELEHRPAVEAPEEALPGAADRRAAAERRAAADRRAGPSLLAEEQLVQGVLDDLQRQIDVMLEYRLREILGPLLARAADSVVRDARSALASTLRDVVARAVADELARHRSG